MPRTHREGAGLKPAPLEEMSHPSYGPLSPEEWQAILDCPAGQAKKIIRRHDPLWGMERDGLKKFKVRVYAEATWVESLSHEFTVDAGDEKQALTVARAEAEEHAWNWYNSDTPENLEFNAYEAKEVREC